jgi:F-type H+-transporting ATPase subunit gamma
MANAKDLRKRIGSVKNTQQITKAMKMVSAAKLRRAQDSIFALRPFAHELNGVITSLVAAQDAGSEANPLLSPREESNSLLLVVVTSDRGLCGAFNGSIIKTVQRYTRTHAHKYKKFDLAFIGKKGYEFFKNKKPGKYYSGFFQGIKFAKAKDLSQELIQMYLEGEYDEIKFVYNEFKSAISQKVNVENYLPVRPPDENQSGKLGMTIYEPNKKEILEALLPKHFATQIYRMALESLASEHGARMAAMENATKNAGEMMRKLTLLYNKTRQAGITKELLEIVSGTEAQKA